MLLISDAIKIADDIAPGRVKLWRRGAAPAPATPADHGYFGPDSLVWRVFAEPAVIALEAQVTALLEFRHRGMQAVLLGHDPAFKAADRGDLSTVRFLARLRRTVGVPTPTIYGDTATADRLFAHLHKVHRPMEGTIPGSDDPYSARGTELLVFAHVTIFHAALRIYEQLAWVGGRPPRRLPDHERDRYWDELAIFAELMGADPAAVPRTAAQVERYYDSIADQYAEIPGFRHAEEALRSPRTLLPRSIRDVASAPMFAGVMAGHVLGFAVAPPTVRRMWGIPAALDPALAAQLHAARPAMAPLALPAIGDPVIGYVAGGDSLRLVRSARRLMQA